MGVFFMYRKYCQHSCSMRMLSTYIRVGDAGRSYRGAGSGAMKNPASISLSKKKTSYKYIKSNTSFATVTLLSLLILSFETVADPIFSEACVSAHFHEEARIKSIIDGDTVILTDDRHIRLIGINTPEIDHNNIKRSDAGALEAKASLVELLKNQKSVHLIYGEERFDRHKRTLAHLYLKNGLNIQAELLRQGQAMPLRIAPNLSLADCYNTASLSAKQKKLGLWALPQYQTRHVLHLKGSEKGFHIISSKVKRITESRSSIWLNLQNNVALRIRKDDLNYFNKNDLMSLQGKTIEANGWLYKRNKQLRMRIQHKLDLRIINDERN